METIYCGNGEEKKVVVVKDMEKYDYCTQLDRGDKVIIIDDYDNTKAYVFRKPLYLGDVYVGETNGMIQTQEIVKDVATVVDNDLEDHSLQVEFSNGEVQWISYAVVDHNVVVNQNVKISLDGIKFLQDLANGVTSPYVKGSEEVEEPMPKPVESDNDVASELPTYNTHDSKDVLIHLLANECGKGEGSVWEIHECPYVVAQVDFGKFALVSLHTFNRWSNPKPFTDLYNEIIDMQNHEGMQYLGLFKDLYTEMDEWTTL